MIFKSFMRAAKLISKNGFFIQLVEPVVVQSGFGVIFFYFGLVNLRKIGSEFGWRIFSANLSALFFQDFSPPPPQIHAPNSRPKLSALFSNFTFLNPNFFVTPIFCLQGRPKLAALHPSSHKQFELAIWSTKPIIVAD